MSVLVIGYTCERLNDVESARFTHESRTSNGIYLRGLYVNRESEIDADDARVFRYRCLVWTPDDRSRQKEKRKETRLRLLDL